MTRSRGVVVFHWILGLALLYLSLYTAIHGIRSHQHEEQLHLGLVGTAEAIGAVLFLVPRTLRIGGWVLLVVILGALAVHLFSGQIRADLAVYAAGVWLVMEKSG